MFGNRDGKEGYAQGMRKRSGNRGEHWRKWEDSDRGFNEGFADQDRDGANFQEVDREHRQQNFGGYFGGRDFGRTERDDSRRYNARGYGQGFSDDDRDYSMRNYPGLDRQEDQRARGNQSYGRNKYATADVNPYPSGDYGWNQQRDHDRYRISREGGRRMGDRSENFDRDQPPSWSGSVMDAHSYVGKGPKGYRRADSRIHEEACEALTHDHEVDASDIDIKVEEGIVILSGAVESRRMKRKAEHCVEDIFGVEDVRNELKVTKQGASLWEKITGHETEKSSPNRDQLQ